MENIGHDELWQLRKRVWRSHPELHHHVSAMRRLLLRELQLGAGYSEAEADSGAEQAFAAFLRERQRVELYAQALDVLEALSRHYRLGALTNGNADVYKTDAGEYFDFAFLAEDVGASKPAPDMFQAALDITGVTPAEVLHVGDNPEHDVRGALNMGMRAVWINADNKAWEGGAGPDASVRHVRELPAVLAKLSAD